MPFYTYKCPDCEKKFDELRKMDERDSPIKCLICDGWATPTVTAPYLKGFNKLGQSKT